MRRRACLALGLADAVVLPAHASAAVTMTDFKVEPASKLGGGHPNVVITQEFSYDNTTDTASPLRDGRVASPAREPAVCGEPPS